MGRKGNQNRKEPFKKIPFGKITGRDYDNERYRGRGGGYRGGHGGGRGGGRGHARNQNPSRMDGFRGFGNGQAYDDSQQRFQEDRPYNKDESESHGGNRYRYAPQNNQTNQNINQEQTKEPPPLMSVAVPSPAHPPQQSVAKETQPNIKTDTVPVEKPSASLKSAEPATQGKAIKAVKSEPMLDIKSIKKEKLDSVSSPVTKKVVAKKKDSSSDSSSSSSSSSSEDSSSDEERIPPMPKPINTKTTKKDLPPEDDVVCLGKQSNIESLLDDDDDDAENDKKQCLVCKSKKHSSEKCTMKCTKCSHSSYSVQIACNTCGETYPQKVNVPQQTNPFFMFMQFMQFFMSQYTGIKTEMNQPIPGPNPVRGCTNGVEITRQDIVESSRRHHKKLKSETKSRKKRKSEKSTDSGSDSDSSSKATTSIKKRKKTDAAHPTTPVGQPKQQSVPQFLGAFPNTVPFPSPAYNPMLAFTQMMGMNPAAMNFPR